MNKRCESMGIEKEPKNHLDSFDFCLRKSIAVHVFGKKMMRPLRNLQGLLIRPSLH